MSKLANIDLTAVDSKDIYSRLIGLPEELEKAWVHFQNVDLSNIKDFDRILILGMGGSGISGDLIQALAFSKSPYPIQIVKDYQIPAYVNEQTLVVAISYSGDTEETLAALDDAGVKGAQAVAITSGGELAKKALELKMPLLQFEYDSPPRSAHPWLFGAVLVLFDKLKLIEVGGELASSTEKVKSFRDQLKLENNDNNLAKEWAGKLYGKVPVIMAASPLTAIASRFKGQINENAKNLAYTDFFPELCHNSTVGFNLPKAAKELMIFVQLSSNLTHERNVLRENILRDIAAKEGFTVEPLKIEAEGLLELFLKALLMVDMTSWYLAVLNEVDPFPVDIITHLKNELAKVQ